LRIIGKAGDGRQKIDPIAPWAFGSGYAAVFDVKEIHRDAQQFGLEARRLTITLPKSYLYRHEWALGNGNSQIGINVRLSGGGAEYFLTRSTRRGDDAESLSVLELTDKPTRAGLCAWSKRNRAWLKNERAKNCGTVRRGKTPAFS
jgi:hypothetical protein